MLKNNGGHIKTDYWFFSKKTVIHAVALENKSMVLYLNL